MKKAGRIAIEVFIIVLLAVLLIGGALFYSYQKTDESQVPYPEFSLGGTALAPDDVQWYTPVFDGLMYKSYAAKNAQNKVQLPDVTAPTLTAVVPQNTELTVSGADGAALVPDENGVYTFTKNGDYTYEASYAVPEVKGQAFGTLHYSGSFTVAVKATVAFSAQQISQGGVVCVRVSGILDGSVPEITTTLGYAQFAKTGSDYVADIGAAYNTEAGQYDVHVTCGALSEQQTVTVIPAEFETQNMTIDTETQDSTMNNPNAAPEWRKVIWPLYEQGDDTVYWSGLFQKPLNSIKVNTTYGLFRYTNGSQTAERHAGVDLDAEEGDPVYAAAAGRVVYAGTLIYTGNTVVIEHGCGLKTYYFHMSALGCKQNDMVTAGQQIGAVGSTGYSTGPHLHFEARIGRQSIDPMALLDGSSGIYFEG